MSDYELKSLFSETETTLNLSPPPRLSLSLSPGMQLCALETRKMDRNLEMSQRYPGPGRQQVLGSRGTWSLHGDKAQVSVSLLHLRVVSNWTLHIALWPALRSAGGGRQVVAVTECKWSPTWWLTSRCVFIPCLMTLSTASRPTHAAVLQKWATDNNPQWCVKGEH